MHAWRERKMRDGRKHALNLENFELLKWQAGDGVEVVRTPSAPGSTEVQKATATSELSSRVMLADFIQLDDHLLQRSRPAADLRPRRLG